LRDGLARRAELALLEARRALERLAAVKGVLASKKRMASAPEPKRHRSAALDRAEQEAFIKIKMRDRGHARELGYLGLSTRVRSGSAAHSNKRAAAGPAVFGIRAWNVLEPGEQIVDHGPAVEDHRSTDRGSLRRQKGDGSSRGRHGSENKAPTELLGIGAKPAPHGLGEAQGKVGALDLDAQLHAIADAQQVEGAARSSRLVHQFEPHLGESSSDLKLRFVTDDRHGHDRAAWLAPAEPERKHWVRQLIEPIGAMNHGVAQPLEVASGRTARGSDVGGDLREALGAFRERLEDRRQGRGLAYGLLQLVREK
jgi:hypothetical protein